MNIVRLMLLSRQMKNRRHEKNNMVTGIPPLTFNAVAGTLENYRIYGNIVSGESVGDRTKNLWNGVVEQGSVSTTGNYSDDSQRIRSRNIALTPGTYSISCNLYIRCIYAFNGQTKVECVKDLGGGAIQSTQFTVPDNADNVSVSLRAFDSNNQPIDVSPSDFEWGQIEQGSTVTTYEPYGYRVPVTVTNGTDTETTNIYLPEQLRMVGTEADYIDYGEQKQHFADGTSVDVTLPSLPTLSGTNTLTVGTEVQPSRVELTGRVKEAQTNGSGNT